MPSGEPDGSAPAARSRWRALAAAVAAVLATVVLLRPWWNRHLGLSLDGYMPLYGHLILSGKIPYRDFFLHLPPLQPLLEAALEALAGRSLYAVRVVGALGRVAIAAITAAWFARRFRPATALVVAFAGICLLSSDDTEILDLYNQWSTLAAVASGWLACLALDRGRGGRALWVASGIAAAAAFWTKQTVGLGAAVAVPIALGWIALRDRAERRQLTGGVALFGAGWAAVAAAIGGWLALHGAWTGFVDDVFRAAAASKGSPLRLLIRPWVDPFLLPQIAEPALVGLSVALVAFAASGVRVPARRGQRFWYFLLVLATLGLVGVVFAGFELPSWIDAGSAAKNADRLRPVIAAGVFAGLFGIVPISLALLVRGARRTLDAAERELLVLALVSGAIAATHAFSFPAGGNSGMPSTALVLALAIEAPGRRRVTTALRTVPIAACLAATLASIAIHRVEPFQFAQWCEPPTAQATEESALPELSGLQLSGATVRAVDDLVNEIRRATAPDEPLFTYPVYPIFNWLADRPLATFAILHWIDVTPDAIVERDLTTLRAHPPVAVVAQWIPDRTMALNEDYFRRGRPSGMRAMRDQLWSLLRRDYVQVLERQVPRRRGPPLTLWLRRDRAVELGIEASDAPVIGAQPRPDAEVAAPPTR